MNISFMTNLYTCRDIELKARGQPGECSLRLAHARGEGRP